MKRWNVSSLCLAMLAACLLLSAQTQDWQWLSYSSGVGAEYCIDLAVDSAGNSWVVGTANNACQFGPYSHTATGFFSYVAKADAQGSWLWLAWTGSSTDNSQINSVKVDAAGNAYVTGIFSGTVSFGSTNLTSTGGADVFVAKLSSAGAWLWARRAGEASTDSGYGLALDSYANVYVTGNSGSSVFIIAYSSSGVPLGGAAYACTGYAVGRDIEVDASGNAFVAGYFTGTVTFGATTLTSAGAEDAFIIKVTAAGNVDWAKRAGGTDYDRAYSLDLDAVSSVYVTGSFSGTAAFGPVNLVSAGSGDVFVAKLGSGGAWLGGVRSGGTGLDVGLGIAVVDASSFYICGYFSSTASFGSFMLSSLGYYDLFAAKLNSAGAWLWAMGAGSTGGDHAYAVAVDGSGELRLGGTYESDMSVGNQVLPDAETGPYEFPEAFLVKIGAVIPRAPENLGLEMSGGNAILAWSPVTQTIYGQLVTPGEYIVYRSASGQIEGPYTELGRSSGTTYSHEYVGIAQARHFYRVSAYKY